ncbi:uncharacterized protein SPSK_10173 [Sporothrix schenckii 1099-18]|uniref:Uncharacterized protein n=1 Tax=Sporothrix schenckii 1099-18 TaxID=1397361 RepID=A0A0F2M5T9_SPOSC|nr:uncharacterized protein SPSK_10173 [Sporothrix schenckii 1099-18]KJR84170.1 hypothetical protein SPSK_10173 [Sporothrix schenckii 1099-18]
MSRDSSESAYSYLCRTSSGWLYDVALSARAMLRKGVCGFKVLDDAETCSPRCGVLRWSKRVLCGGSKIQYVFERRLMSVVPLR